MAASHASSTERLMLSQSIRTLGVLMFTVCRRSSIHSSVGASPAQTDISAAVKWKLSVFSEKDQQIQSPSEGSSRG